MTTIIATLAFGVLFAGIGLVGLVRPELLAKLLATPRPRARLVVAAALRLLLGIVLIGAAAQSAYPVVLRALGYLALLGAVVVLLIGPSRLQALTEWGVALPRGVIRMAAGAVALLGSFLVYAAFP